MSGLYDNILQLIGHTPIVHLRKMTGHDDADLYAKVESFNPGRSVKDRIALSMVEDAEKSGRLKPGGTIVEPTSGNTGIGLAIVAVAKGYKLILVMPESMSLERRNLLAAYGARLELTPAAGGMAGAINRARQLLREIPDAIMLDQFGNPANPEAHRHTTALEILDQMDGRINAFVAGVGTGGTITGVGEVLKQRIPNIKIIAVEPKTSAVLSGNSAGPHKIQGIGAGFVPQVLNKNIIDEIITVDDNDAFKASHLLAQREGLLTGISSGAAIYAALQVAKRLAACNNVLTILPDTGERYFSMEKYFAQ